MNGAATRKGPGFGPPMTQPPGSVQIGPNGRALVEGYRKDVLGSFDKKEPRFSPISADGPQSSPLVDLKDSVQIHLLTETALLDSKGYQILSQEEVDDLKKQIQSLVMRIEQARTNLAIQTKYRDAAISMAKLYSPSRPEGSKRLSLRSNRMSDSAKEAEMEKLASERRCEELAAELFTLEKSLMVPQRRLLEHTAGILQMTHRASTKKSGQPPPGQPIPNGIPGSPESLYTYTNARNSFDVSNVEPEFGDRSLYLPLDQMDGQATRGRKNTIEIPVKSPIREQNNQLREEMDRVKEENSRIKDEIARVKDENLRVKEEASRFMEENTRLKAAEQNLSAQTEALRTQSSGPMQMIADTEKRLEALNNRLKDVIIGFGPARSIDLGNPQRSTGSGGSIDSQLEYLERGIAAAAEEHESYTAAMAKESETAAATARAAAAAESSLAQAEGRVEGLVSQIQGMFQQLNVDQQLPPDPSNGTLNDQLDYLEDVIRVVGDEMMRLAEAATASSGRQDTDQAEAVLSGLWDIIQSGLAEAQQQKATRRKNRADKGLEPDEEDMSDSEPVDPAEPYTLPAFSTKVQWLFQQATSLKEQKTVLKRQIKQQRELNNKSGTEKDQVIREKEEELDKVRNMLDDSEQKAIEMQEKLAKALGDYERLQKSAAANDSASMKALQDQVKERSAAVAALEASYQEVESNYQEAQSQLAEAEARAAAARKELDEKEKEVKEKDEELDRMNVMVIELKTEVAFAKAELDGAYGSRRERAAEAAALAQSSEMDEKNKEVARLKAELASTLRDFEDITRESITAEKEKLELEGKLDDAVAAKASLEAELTTIRGRLEAEVGRLQEQLDAERLKVPPSPALGGPGGAVGPRAGATMLSEQFRATMKEERKKFQEELRVSSLLFIVHDRKVLTVL
ncbi:Up-regulated during septation-domain-containing protein [Echria macrotheca]|uniref:Up-regulated during septation-domain-containing protein n=1 Tax=Echria macrotheca TaxID=438768 RepID=A0AAJ0BMJ8_9PEZI|nr:Up-regulated during septation-domain-containing protein [Echria macrotheca]